MATRGKDDALTKASASNFLHCAPICLVLALSGCASPGFPRPPSLHLPAPVTDLTATRVADHVELHWTAPTTTTDGLDLRPPTTVEICRDDDRNPVIPPAPPPCTSILKASGHAGPSTSIDQLPTTLTSATTSRRLLGYRVRVLNSSGRGAAPTAIALIPDGPPPAPVEAFNALQNKDGVLLKWQGATSGAHPVDDVATVEVLRTDLTPKPPAPTAPVDTPTESPSYPKSPNPLAPVRRTKASPETRLRPDAPATASQPPASLGTEGMIDQSALPEGTYSYRAQRVTTIAIGGKTFEILSEPTPPITITMRDIFPPEIPQGLLSVPGTTVQPADHFSHPTIDLSWQPDTEPDLAGYHVYRTDLSLGATSGNSRSVRLTASPIPAPAFRDATVLPGHRYTYRITAVDRSGNESAPSASIEDSPEGR